MNKQGKSKADTGFLLFLLPFILILLALLAGMVLK